VINALSVIVAMVLHHFIGDPQPPASVQAFAEVGVVKWPPVPRVHRADPPSRARGGASR
jgi:hypothetical protein